MFKKYMAMFMACAIALTLSVPMIAFASSSTYSGEAASPAVLSADGKGEITMKYTSVTQMPVLNVKIANHAGLILNPYMLKYTADNGRASFDGSTDFMLGEYGASSGTQQDTTAATYRQIISSPMVIESTTEVPILVGVSVNTTVKSSNENDKVTLKTTDIVTSGRGVDTGKSIYMWLAADASQAGDTNEKACVQRALALDAKTDTTNHTLVLTEETTKVPAVTNDSFVTIPAATTDARSNVTPGYAAFVFGGRMVVEPAITNKTGTTPDPWSKDDVVSPTVTLTLSLTEFDWSSDKNATP